MPWLSFDFFLGNQASSASLCPQAKRAREKNGSQPLLGDLSKIKQIDGRKRPRKRTKFINWIKPQCPGFSSTATPEEVCKELVMVQLVQESGTNITYRLGR
ncbi:hypothetical protein DESC_70081 [Desulfosarcina cetonica]|nr:hypothetical protein DESC_70081 [Desulfosarcina cetonica]